MSEWIALRVDVAEDAADAVAAFFFEEGCGGVITGVIDREGPEPPPGRTTVEAHVATATADDVTARLHRHLARLATIDPAWATAHVTMAPVPVVDWNSVFRAQHHPMPVGRRLIILPPWIDPREVPEARGREILVVEPGMAFGTGQHATTRTCLEEIETLVAANTPASMLDIGTGSGILAAAAARLGVPRVAAVDLDPLVLPLARAMLDQNACARVSVFGGGAGAVRGAWDLVVANLLLDAILADRVAITNTVAPSGTLVLSGLLDDQVTAIDAAFDGWRITHTRAEGRWRTLRCVRAA